MRFLIVFGLLFLFALPARAEYVGCNPAQINALQKALDNARNAVSEATIAVNSENTVYERWFGRWDQRRASDVRRSLSAIKAVLDETVLVMHCSRPYENGCSGSIYANVWPDNAYNINICNNFFNLPQLSGDKREAGFNHVGTMAGTLVHEVSHFNIVAATDDHIYGRGRSIELALESPGLAVRNADSYQYFVEDAFLKAR